MAAIVKTWPAFMEPSKVKQVFSHNWGTFYFTIGRGKPGRPIEQIYFTHRGILLGHFDITGVVQNVGQLPRLRSLSNEESTWQIKGDRWVAVCAPPFHPLEEEIYHDSFRGWRYFDLDAFRGTMEAKIRL